MAKTKTVQASRRAAVSSSPKKKKASNRKPAGGSPAGSFVAPSRSFVFEVADEDACDRYRFAIEPCDKGLAITYEGCGASGKAAFSETAVSSSRSFITLSQGSAIGSDGERLPKQIKHDLPPFLLSRKVFAELRKGSSKLRPDGEEGRQIDVEVVAKGTALLVVEGAERAWPALKVAGRSLELWVLDDEQWPFVILYDRGENYWHLLAQGGSADLESDDDATGNLITDEKPVSTVAPANLDDEAGIIAALKSERAASAEDAYKAAERAGTLSSPESREALFFALASQSNVSGAAYRALYSRAKEPGFVEALQEALAATSSRVEADPSDKRNDEYDRRAEELLRLALALGMGQAPLLDLLRSIARSHPNLKLRTRVLGGLADANDPPIVRELVEQFDAGQPLVNPEMFRLAVRVALQQHPAIAEARLKIEKLIAAQTFDTPEQRWTLALNEVETCADAGWCRQLVSWWVDAENAKVRERVGYALCGVFANGRAAFYVDDLAQIERLVSILINTKHDSLQTNMARVLELVKKPQAMTAILALLETEHFDAVAGVVGKWVQQREAATLAPLISKVLPRARFLPLRHISSYLWNALLEAEAPEWGPVLEEFASFLQAKNDPQYDDMIRSVRSRGRDASGS
jgi:hypothetical protein